MAGTKAKITLVTSAAVLVAAGTTTPIILHHHRDQANAAPFSWRQELSERDNASLEQLMGATPAQAARTFLEALSREDWDETAKSGYGQGKLGGGYAGLQILSLGKPFKAKITVAKLIEMQPKARAELGGRALGDQIELPSVFVPYEVRFKDGTVKKWQLSVRRDDSQHRWFIDGGL
jgi:hypothetical protein